MRKLAIALSVVALVGLTTVVRADDKPNPTGTWKWSVEANGRTRTSTLKLKLEGDKLSGAMVGRNDMETAITDATYKNGEVSFSITRERNGNKMTTKYTGKITGDTLKGKIETERNGEKQTREFEAKREKA